MTTWVEESEGGRARGPRGLVRAWLEVLVRPRRFFRTGIAPGDQAPGLVFAIGVATCYTLLTLATQPARRPTQFGGEALSAFVVLGAVALLVAPAVLHLTAAVETVLVLLAATRVRRTLRSVRAAPLDPRAWETHRLDRGGVSETVQVIAYASAPGLFAAVPFPPLQVAAVCYGGWLLVAGTRTVHEFGPVRSLIAGLPPAVFLFGYGFGGLAALRGLVGL